MNLISIVLLIVSILNLILGAFIYFRNRKNIVNVSITLFAIFCGLWSFGMMMYAKDPIDAERILLWSRILYFAGSGIAGSFLYFALVFSSKKRLNIFKTFLLATPILICFVLLFCTNLILENRINIYPNNRQLVLGYGYIFYFVHFFIYMLVGLYVLLKKSL